MNTHLLWGFAAVALLAAWPAAGATYDHDPNVAQECRVRGGLPNVAAKLNAGEPIRIAYLGGSITAARGWRPKTVAWFQKEYPKSEIVEINVAISGTGSDYSACRLREDVLSQTPDLVFLECRVNGGGGFERESVEGVVRHIWQQSPRTDICFVYTISHSMLKGLQASKPSGFGRIMETIANHYGIPSIDLGVEVAKREKAGSLIFKADSPVEGKLVFSRDGVHPGDAGHDLYREIIARSMKQILKHGAPADHSLPGPLVETNWQVATLLPIRKAVLSDGWETVDVDDDPVYTESRGRTHAMLRGAVKCDRVGASVTVKWHGTNVGISDIPYGEPAVLEAVVDGGTPILVKRTQRESTKYSRFWYLPSQTPGDHTVIFTVKELPAGQSFYMGQLLIVGKPLP